MHIFVHHMDILQGCVHNLPLLDSFPYVQPYIHTFMYMYTCIYVCVYGGAEGAGGGVEAVDKNRAMICVCGNCVSHRIFNFNLDYQ